MKFEDRIILPESDLSISKLVQALSPQYLTASYKLYWLLGILDIIKDFPSERSINIEFDDVIRRMIALSWYTILEYRLNFGASDTLEKAVHYIESNTELNRNSCKKEIVELLENSADSKIIEIIHSFSKYVPYRFLTTFIPKLNGIPDHKRNSVIEEASKTTPDIPYAISGKTCVMDLKWLEYLYLNNSIIKGWVQYKLVSFLQARNPNVPAITEKFEAPHQRNLEAARKYWTEYISFNDSRDIFSHQPMRATEISIDHFVPWSFVLHDRIWNLAPTSRELNSSKSNHLPMWEKYFKSFAELQFRAFKWHSNKTPSSKVLEDFILIKPGIAGTDISRESFFSILENTLQPAYRIAANQGFSVWENKG